MQDVGGMGFQPGDKHALTEDTVDAPLSVAIEKSGKPVKYWEYVLWSRDLFRLPVIMTTGMYL
ncbi:hypothetical protein ABBQ38_012428 [Trebouxia sp. C0009 RCD-2024]